MPRREHAFTRGARTSTTRLDTDTRVTIIEKERASVRLYYYGERTTNRVPLAAAERCGYVSFTVGCLLRLTSCLADRLPGGIRDG